MISERKRQAVIRPGGGHGLSLAGNPDSGVTHLIRHPIETPLKIFPSDAPLCFPDVNRAAFVVSFQENKLLFRLTHDRETG